MANASGFCRRCGKRIPMNKQYCDLYPNCKQKQTKVLLHGGPNDGMCVMVTNRDVKSITFPLSGKYYHAVHCPIDEPFYKLDSDDNEYYRCTDGKYRRQTFGQVVYINTSDGHFKYEATYPAEELEWQG